GVTDDFNSYGTYGLNQGVFTTMSCNVGWPQQFGAPHIAFGLQGTPMALDIGLLQEKYAPNMTTNAGDTIYTLPVGNLGRTYFSAIWDTGGVDQIVSFDAGGAVIDLRAATLLNDFGGGGYVSHNNGTIGGYTIAAGVVIENARGWSGSDTITGNDAANTLI